MYLFAILNNVFPDCVEGLIEEIKEKRKKTVPDGEKIELSQAMKELINSAQTFGVYKKDRLKFGIKKSRNWNFDKKKNESEYIAPELIREN